MEIRFFQILVPIIALLYLSGLLVQYRKSRITFYELLFGTSFWLGAALLAFFPDFFSGLIAQLFDIKSNVNGIIFFCLGILFFMQFKLFFTIRKQEKALTLLTRQLALKDLQKEEDA